MFFSVLCLLCLCTRLFIFCALWSPAGKGLTSWLSFVVYNCELFTFPLYPGSGVVLCALTYFALVGRHLRTICPLSAFLSGSSIDQSVRLLSSKVFVYLLASCPTKGCAILALGFTDSVCSN